MAQRSSLPVWAVTWLTIGHFANDFFSGSLGILLAAQREVLDLSNTEIGIATSLFYGVSLTQPFLGWLADRSGKPYLLISGALWTALGLAICGFAESFTVIAIGAIFGGLGNAMFHPVGLASARAFGQEAAKGRSLAFFMLGGNGGFAVGPLVIGFVLEGLGPRGMATPFLLSLILVPLTMLRLRPAMQVMLAPTEQKPNTARSQSVNLTNQGMMLIGVYAALLFLRGGPGQVIINYLPTYYEQSGTSLSFAGTATGILLLFAALGSFIGSTLSDYFPRSTIIVTSLLLMTPLTLLLLAADGIWVFIISAFLGLMLNANWPLLLMIGQEVMPGGASSASGFVFGWAFFSSSAGTFVTGILADQIGLKETLQLSSFVPLLAVGLVLLMPRDKRYQVQPGVETVTAPGD